MTVQRRWSSGTKGVPREEREEQIPAAAEAEFGERGYAGASIQRVAAASGISRALVHSYFATKDDLYAACVERAGSPPAWFWPAAAGVGAVAGLMLRALWGSLGKLRLPVVAYVLAIVGMVISSLLLPTRAWPATAGALAFMASDAVLSFDLFKGAKLFGSPRLTAWAVWFLYWGGQAAICHGMLS